MDNFNTSDILTLAYKHAPLADQMVLLYDKEQQMPGSVHYTIRRYSYNPQSNIEDTGVISYHYSQDDPKENCLELKFCVSGNMYCRHKETECNMCKAGLSRNCADKTDSV